MSSTNCDASRWRAADGSLVALADCDNFFVSCERLSRPDLRDRPVVVLSNNDGCVVSRSPEAKALGIPMGAPAFKLRDQFRRDKVEVFSSNYALYGDLSRRVMRTLATIAPEVEEYSIDEAFLPLPSALASQAEEVAKSARARVLQWVGIPVSIGIAPTRTLAKIACEVAKRHPDQARIFDLSREKSPDALLARVPVVEIWGVGRKNAFRLKEIGIHSALQLRDADPARVRSLLTITGLNIQMELRGVPSFALDDAPLSRRTLLSSRSFGHKVRDIESLREAVATYAGRAAEKLRKQNLVTSCVAVHIRTSRHESGEGYDQTEHQPLEAATSDTLPIIRAAHAALERIYRPGFNYMKAGVMLFELSEAGRIQGSLLAPRDAENESKRARLMQALDRINGTRHGGAARLVRFAVEGTGARPWHMRREHLSPAWTTHIHELLKVR